MPDEVDVENEIEQADVFKERVQRAIIDATSAITAKEAPVSEHSSVVMPPPPHSSSRSHPSETTKTVIKNV